MERMSSHYLNGGSLGGQARQQALRPSDFIGASSNTLSRRLKAAGIPEDALEKAAEEAVSDMARRFAPDVMPDEHSKKEIAHEFPQLEGAPEAMFSSPLSAAPRPQIKPASTSPWLLAALVIACAAPSAVAGYMLWTGDLSVPFTSVAVEPPETASRGFGQEQAVTRGEVASPKSEARLEQQAIAAISDPMTRSSIQPKTAIADPAAISRPARALEVSIAPALDAQASNTNKLAISVQPASAIPAGARISLLGLPEGALLSAGEYRLDGWSLPAEKSKDLADLKVTVPEGGGGEAMLTVTVKSIAGRTLAQGKTVIELQSEPALQQDNAPKIAGMMESGQKMMDVGYISGARAYYIRAAEAGSPEGAMAAAGTFDPKALAAILAFGVLPDVAQARRWYERAKGLGAGDADAKLASLPDK